VQRFNNDRNFTLLAEINDSTPPRFNKFWIALVACTLMILLPLFWKERFSLINTAVYASAVMIAIGCISAADASKAVSWDVIITIACAFGFSAALEKTNLATLFGQGISYVAASTQSGFWGVLLATYLATSLLSLIVANNAAALLMFPIGVQAAQDSCPDDQSEQQCLEKQMFILMLGASACFASPYGYQTNLMVMAPGHYTFLDFVRFGGFMQLWQVASDVTFVYFVEKWYINWVVSIGAFVLVAAYRAFGISKCIQSVTRNF